MTAAAPIPATSPQVWLIKAPPSVSGESYTTELEAAGFAPLYIPALVEEFETSELESLLTDGENEWDGVIITSKRGAEGWVRAVKGVTQRYGQISGFSEIPLFTVGTTSIEALAGSDISHHLLPDMMDATTAKSALELAQRMLESLPCTSSDQASPRRYLFIRGDKSANDLQPILRKSGCLVHEVQVYSTAPNPDLTKIISEACASYAFDQPLWLAFFSPSTAGFALPHLKDLMEPNGGAGGGQVKIAAIGEKTRAFLEESNIQVDAMATEPNAEGLVQALRGKS